MKRLVKSLEFAITIYNTFMPVRTKTRILGFAIFSSSTAKNLMPPVTISLAGENFVTTFQTTSYLVAAAKHLGDMCQVIGRLTPEDVRILKAGKKPRKGR